jgi:small subunit ribosomal protein S21
MLIIPVKEGESIEKALKKYKKKFERTGVMKELRQRQKFTKPSVENRELRLKAIYKNAKYGTAE